jgi:hypothetical protein
VINHRSTEDQSWFITDQHRSSLDHCRSIADYKRSNANYHWSIDESYKPIVDGYILCNSMLTNTDLSPNWSSLFINMF